LALLGTVASPSASAQGFGKVKKKITLRRKLPPIAPISGSFAVKATARDARFASVAQKFADILETEILRYDNRLTVDRDRPDTLVACSITQHSTPPPVARAQTTLTKKGQKPVYSYEVNGVFNLSYQARTRDGRALDSTNVTSRYHWESEDSGGLSPKAVTDLVKKPWNKIKGNKKDEETETARTLEEVSQILLSRAAAQIAARLVRTDEPVEIYLARGELDDYNKYAEAALWSRMLEPLETRQPFPDKEDDAYRLYNVGVVYEAMAYAAEDPKAARRFLDQAAIHYGKAIDAKPSEKYFLEPQNRIQTALLHYRTIASEPVSTSGGASRAPTRRAGDAVAPEPAPAGALTNQQIIELTRGGMEDATIIAAIRQAPAVKFDLSSQAQLRLVQSGVKGVVISAMRARVSPPAAKKSGGKK
jgi:hypothetical protein